MLRRVLTAHRILSHPAAVSAVVVGVTAITVAAVGDVAAVDAAVAVGAGENTTVEPMDGVGWEGPDQVDDGDGS